MDADTLTVVSPSTKTVRAILVIGAVNLYAKHNYLDREKKLSIV